ncbi:MAG: CRISPR-associated protein Csm7 [Methylovulum sp.]|nr:CRISPR-associated protein Csm7 [Methylovulum sp.]
MERLIFTLTPKTAFATPLAGDTLFGQACWAIRHCFSEAKLTALLAGYTENKPFMVLSDAMPQGFLSRPTLPSELLGFEQDAKQRKIQKAKKWFPESVLATPLNQWAKAALTEGEMLDTLKLPEPSNANYKVLKRLYLTKAQDHNSLNRKTGTTGGDEGVFAPFQRQTYWYHPDIQLSLIVELDTERFSVAELTETLHWIGFNGYGKEASCGLGKFAIELAVRPEPVEGSTVEGTAQPNAWLTLAPCAPQNLSWHALRCYYQTLTRFGRHGDSAVHQRGGAFKNPVLMAATGAVLSPKGENPSQGFTGQGITGVSKTIEATVHQGYAPVYPVRLEVTV